VTKPPAYCTTFTPISTSLQSVIGKNTLQRTIFENKMTCFCGSWCRMVTMHQWNKCQSNYKLLWTCTVSNQTDADRQTDKQRH